MEQGFSKPQDSHTLHIGMNRWGHEWEVEKSSCCALLASKDPGTANEASYHSNDKMAVSVPLLSITC